MKSFLIFTLFVVAVSAAFIGDEQSEDLFYLVPVHRVRRQTTYDIRKDGPGTTVTLGHQGKIFENDNHRVTGGGFASKQFHPSGPLTVGGKVGYEHIPSGSSVNIGAQNTHHFGTSINADANLNLLRSRDGNTRLDATAGYSRSFGGLHGTGAEDYNAGINFIHTF